MHKLDFNIYNNILENAHEGIYFVDTHRKITFWNEGAASITGFSPKDVTGRCCQDNILNHVDENGTKLCIHGCPLHQTLQDGQKREANVFLRHKDGHRTAVSIRIFPIMEEDRIIGASELFVDNAQYADTERTMKELTTLALYDELTQMPNRRYLDSIFNRSLAEYAAYARPFGILFIDIDKFKPINDTYGHQVGDNALKVVSGSLKNAFRANDMIGRWGGDEFLAILPGVTEDELIHIAKRAIVLVENSTFDSQKGPLSVTISVGAAMAKPGDTMDTLFYRADKALLNCKRSKRNHLCFL